MATPAPSSTPPLHPWEITPQDVARMLRDGEDFLFVDCRTEDEHEQARIKGARLMPMQDLDLYRDDLERYRDRPIVIHCRSGKRSLNVTAALRAQGFVDVRSMAGGIQRWSDEIDPSVPRV